MSASATAALLLVVTAAAAPQPPPAGRAVLGASKELPSTCLEVLYREPASADGDYVLQCSPADVAFDVHCAGMNSSAPREYLTLPAVERLNFFEYLCGDECQQANGGDSTVHTAFIKVRINPCTLFVDVLDYTFSESRGRVTHVDSGTGDTTVYTRQPFGTAGSCEGGSGSGPGGAGGPAGRGNLDVRGRARQGFELPWAPSYLLLYGSKGAILRSPADSIIVSAPGPRHALRRQREQLRAARRERLRLRGRGPGAAGAAAGGRVVVDCPSKRIPCVRFYASVFRVKGTTSWFGVALVEVWCGW